MKGYIQDDKNTFCVPRHSSSTTMQTFVKWGRVGQYVAGSRIDTTILTTKKQVDNLNKGKCFRRNPK